MNNDLPLMAIFLFILFIRDATIHFPHYSEVGHTVGF